MEENEEMKRVEENFKKSSFPSFDEFTELQKKNDEMERGNNSLITAVEGTNIRHEGTFDTDEFIIVSTTRKNEKEISARKNTLSEKDNNLKPMSMDDLKIIRATSLFDDENNVLKISDVRCLSRKSDNECRRMRRQPAIEDLTEALQSEGSSDICEMSLSKDTQGEMEVINTNNATENKNMMFVSKTDVKEFLQQLNQDNSQNTDILIKEMRECNHNLARSFQQSVTSAFQEVTVSIKEMKDHKVCSAHDEGLTGCVGHLYQQITKGNEEMKDMIKDLIHCSNNDTFRYKRCRKITPDEQCQMGNLTGPDEQVPSDKQNTNIRHRLKDCIDDTTDDSDTESHVAENHCTHQCKPVYTSM